MKLTVLGAGPTMPHPTRSSSGYWLETLGGKLLLDCSATVPSRMAQEGLDWPGLDAVWISHFHLDHCGGVPILLAGTKHAEQMKHRTKPLRIFGPRGLAALVDGFNNVNNYRLLEQPFPVEIVEIDEDRIFEILPGVEAVARKTPHTGESHAIRLRDTGGKTLVYTADTGFDLTIGEFAKSADLLVMECTFVRDKPIKKHLELSEAMAIITQASPKRAMLTHFYPEWDDVDFDAEVARFRPVCEVVQAEDGLRMEI